MRYLVYANDHCKSRGGIHRMISIVCSGYHWQFRSTDHIQFHVQRPSLPQQKLHLFENRAPKNSVQMLVKILVSSLRKNYNGSNHDHKGREPLALKRFELHTRADWSKKKDKLISDPYSTSSISSSSSSSSILTVSSPAVSCFEGRSNISSRFQLLAN